MNVKIKGRELLEFIEGLGDLAWAKFETRYPVIEIKGSLPKGEDRSGRPPYASFRFENENPEVVVKLKNAVENYQGEIRWVMDEYQRISFPGTRNWIIHPKKMAEIKQVALDSNLTPGQYMEKVEPMFGPKAYDDLENLVGYLQEFFQ